MAVCLSVGTWWFGQRSWRFVFVFVFFFFFFTVSSFFFFIRLPLLFPSLLFIVDDPSSVSIFVALLGAKGWKVDTNHVTASAHALLGV